MSAETMQLLTRFEALPAEEKQAFVKELFRRLPPYDSGPLEDDEVVVSYRSLRICAFLAPRQRQKLLRALASS